MATTKNITMKQFNGTDYDTLYPKTNVEQVENLTPSSIGAVANTGGIMTGNLTIQNSSYPDINLKNTGSGSATKIRNSAHRTQIMSQEDANNYRVLTLHDKSATTNPANVLTIQQVEGGVQKATYDVLHTGNLSALGVAKIVTGSYVGTGGYKESNPTTLSFDFVPKVVIFYQKDSGGVSATTTSKGGALLVNGVTQYYVSDYIGNASYTKYITITWNGNSVSWYGDNAEAQMNKSGIEYVYAAFG